MAIQWKIWKRTKVARYIFVLALTFSQILTFQILNRMSRSQKYNFRNDTILIDSEWWMFQIFYFQKVGQGHEGQFWQWCHSMVNINVYKSRPMHLYANSYLFRDINISNSKPYVRSQKYDFRNDTIRWQMSKSTKVVPFIFALALTISNFFFLQKVGKGQGIQFSQWRHSLANVKICKVVSCRFVLALTISVILLFKIFP